MSVCVRPNKYCKSGKYLGDELRDEPAQISIYSGGGWNGKIRDGYVYDRDGIVGLAEDIIVK